MILDNLDKDATCAQAKKLLRNFHSLQRIAGRKLTLLQSPAMTGMPRSQSVENHNERRIQQRLIAREEVPAILEAIASLDEDSQKIINGQFLKGDTTNTHMAEQLGLSSSAYSQAKKQALISFAEAFYYEELLVFE